MPDLEPMSRNDAERRHTPRVPGVRATWRGRTRLDSCVRRGVLTVMRLLAPRPPRPSEPGLPEHRDPNLVSRTGASVGHIALWHSARRTQPRRRGGLTAPRYGRGRRSARGPWAGAPRGTEKPPRAGRPPDAARPAQGSTATGPPPRGYKGVRLHPTALFLKTPPGRLAGNVRTGATSSARDFRRGAGEL